MTFNVNNLTCLSRFQDREAQCTCLENCFHIQKPKQKLLFYFFLTHKPRFVCSFRTYIFGDFFGAFPSRKRTTTFYSDKISQKSRKYLRESNQKRNCNGKEKQNEKGLRSERQNNTENTQQRQFHKRISFSDIIFIFSKIRCFLHTNQMTRKHLNMF